MKTITLEKVTADKGVPVGETFEYTYKSSPDHVAVTRASKALLRDYPGEDRLHWRAR